MPYKDTTKQKQAQHESYIRNRCKVIAGSRQRHLERSKFIQELKEANPCADCGVSYPYFVMDFDHRVDEEKTANISILMRTAGVEKIKAELEKCDLVCANCHRFRTQKLHE